MGVVSVIFESQVQIYVAGMDDHGVTYGLELDSVRHDRAIVPDLSGIRTLVDEKIASLMQNTVIDFADTCDGHGFVTNDRYLCYGCR